MLRVNQLALSGSSALTPLALAYQASYSYGSSHSSRSYTGCAIGTASEKRYVAVAVMCLDPTDIETVVTVGGAACTKLAGFASGFGGCSVWITDAPVTSGTTATVAVTFAGSVTSSAISVYTIEGTPDFTPVDALAVYSGTPLGARNINAVAGGVVIAAAANTGDSLTCSWTGLTENYDAFVATGTYSSASKSIEADETLSVTAAWSAGTATERLAIVSLKPGG